MSKLSLYVTVPELSQLTGVSIKTLNRQLKQAKVDRTCPIDVTRFVYSHYMQAQERGINLKVVWRDIKQARAEAAKVRSWASIKGQKAAILTAGREAYSRGANAVPLTLDRTEDIPQAHPDY